MILLSIGRIDDRAPRSAIIDVRNCCDNTMPVGHVFDEICLWPKIQARYQPILEVQPTTVIPVNIKVTEIVAYDRVIEALGPGWTARLTVVGDVEKLLTEGPNGEICGLISGREPV